MNLIHDTCSETTLKNYYHIPRGAISQLTQVPVWWRWLKPRESQTSSGQHDATSSFSWFWQNNTYIWYFFSWYTETLCTAVCCQQNTTKIAEKSYSILSLVWSWKLCVLTVSQMPVMGFVGWNVVHSRLSPPTAVASVCVLNIWPKSIGQKQIGTSQTKPPSPQLRADQHESRWSFTTA